MMSAEERARRAVLQFTGMHLPSEHNQLQEIITAAIRDAVAAERERCAKLCDDAALRNWHGDGSGTSPEELAAAIRGLE